MGARMPALFVGHGNPMNALSDNDWTRAWAHLGARLPRPRAVLAISAHWYLPGTRVTATASPRTIHDFGGFPRELFAVRYPAPGDPALAAQVQQLLEPLTVGADETWGLDHGTWSVLCHMYARADVPVVQLSIDETEAAAFHHEIGSAKLCVHPLQESITVNCVDIGRESGRQFHFVPAGLYLEVGNIGRSRDIDVLKDPAVFATGGQGSGNTAVDAQVCMVKCVLT